MRKNALSKGVIKPTCGMTIPSLDKFLSSKNRSEWDDPSFWRGLCPELSISEGEDLRRHPGAFQGQRASEEECKRRRDRLVDDGYALVDDSIESEEVTGKISRSIASLHTHRGLPATFSLLYDETWTLARSAAETLTSSTCPANRFNYDVLAWHVDPREGAAGFSPHRDRQPAEAAPTFHSDGVAKYVTQWVALTDASPENSCLYVIPKQCDPGYINGDDVDDDNGGDGDGGDEKRHTGSDPLQRALSTKESYQNIRALPRRAGQSVLFTHRILHWGSRGNPNASATTGPRIAISFVCSDPTFEAPYLDGSLQDSLPSFRTRLLLVCAQLLIYYQRFDLPKTCVRACYDYVKEKETMLDKEYRKKVYVEFVKAMREDAAALSAKKHQTIGSPVERSENTCGDDDGGVGAAVADDDDDDDDEEAVLEEMLEAEAQGYGEFQDDFDEMASDNGEVGGELPDGSCGDTDDDADDGSTLLFGKRKVAEENVPLECAKKQKA